VNETHSRAKAGGQVGANGEWYEGGQFIATTDHAKSHKRAAKSSGKVEVAPYVWEFAPEGMAPIYRCMRGLEFVRNGRAEFNPRLSGEYATAQEVARRMDRISRFNAGERFEAV